MSVETEGIGSDSASPATASAAVSASLLDQPRDSSPCLLYTSDAADEL